MKKLPSWLLPKPKTATVEELQAQLDAAQADNDAATKAVEDATRAFDEDASTESQLLAARDEQARAREHRERAARLLAAAKKRDEDALREQLTAQHDQAISQLTPDAVEERLRPLVEKQVELLKAFCEVQVERGRLGDELQHIAGDVYRLERQLQGHASYARRDHRDHATNEFITIKALENLVLETRDQELRKELQGLVRKLKS